MGCRHSPGLSRRSHVQVLKRPPGWPYLTLVAIVVVLVLDWVSVPIWYTEVVILLFFGGGALGAYWTIRLCVAASLSPNEASIDERQWLTAPIVAVCLVAVLVADAAFEVRFSLSRSALDRYAKMIAEGYEPGPECRWVGLYSICGGARAVVGGAEILTNQVGMNATRGFLWLPEGRQPSEETNCEDFAHVSGPWWGCKAWDGW